KYLTDIRKSSSALMSIINDILDFSKIEAGKVELIQVNYNARMLIDNLYSMFSILCRNKGLDMTFDIADNLPDRVFGDENRLRQVLTNLMSNAVKYTKKGSVTLSARLEGSDLRFDVSDTGIGIRAEEQELLFDPFVQLDQKRNRNVMGTGLGLAISYKLTQLMGGDLWLCSVYGEGSIFSVSVPYVYAEQDILEEPDEIYDFRAPEARVLVVDDIEINLSVAEALLSAFEVIPDLAMRGADAVKMANNSQYHIIFMDHMMPGMDGLEATKLIRESGNWNESVPIIALTANVVSGMDQIFLGNRMDDVLPKPLEIEALNLCLKKWLPAHMITKT
ncbi:MAG: ATP-binding protein, partial [Clostridiales bacterium]|nr:ATP-binding protein [Clostridiales bacterium]